MARLDTGSAIQVRDGARHFQDAVVGNLTPVEVSIRNVDYFRAGDSGTLSGLTENKRTYQFVFWRVRQDPTRASQHCKRPIADSGRLIP